MVSMAAKKIVLDMELRMHASSIYSYGECIMNMLRLVQANYWLFPVLQSTQSDLQEQSWVISTSIT